MRRRIAISSTNGAARASFLAACALSGTLIAVPVNAVDLARPGGAVFDACAAEMSRDWTDTAARIEAIGWAEVEGYPPALAPLERAREVLIGLECCYDDGSISEEEYEVVKGETAWVEEQGASVAYAVDNFPDSVRIWNSPDGADFVALYDTNEDWYCTIYLAAPPADAAAFAATNHGRRSETYGIDTITFIYDDRGPREKFEFLDLFPFLPTPGLYWADYIFADRDALSALSGTNFPLAFTAEIGVAYRY